MNCERIKNKHSDFSLHISIIIFCYSLIMLLLGKLTPDVLYSFGVLYPILMLLIIIFFVYTLFTRKKRMVIDYIVITILFMAILVITIQAILFLYRSRTGDFYYSLDYIFPGILKLNKHWLISVDPLKYEITSSIFLFDPTLISSFTCMIISITKKIKGGK